MAKELICWDSSVFISWFRGEIEDPGRIQSIRPVIEEVEKGICRLVVSTLIYVEVLNTRGAEDRLEEFKEFMQNRERVEILAVDIRVAQKAGEIRNNTNIKTPDAIHVATAIVGRAKLFHTFDDDLLQLSGKDVIEDLVITACSIPGKNLEMF